MIRFREPLNSFTHLFGAIFSLIALVAMLVKAVYTQGSVTVLLSVLIFGVSLILLYCASTIYHATFAKQTVIKWLRKIDHAMIFILIAGTYTPFCLIALDGMFGLILLIVIWTIALSGIIFKLTWFSCPRWFSTLLYILMGWLIAFAFVPLSRTVEPIGLSLLLIGGIIYTLGGIIYAIKPNWIKTKHLGFHEVFHLFILAGSLAHFLSVYQYLL
ncbi:hemolysin III [Amphibacillus marinus]|uniref:Hemolysin III n=1 Tax=Amphibacillus marinus TaxID=872970 RepID=A0A1H8MEL5_9BACI|nr:hemolysin III family protein [Amphibacillus marinus]SEO15787.1 hemolysin III [Amphibacillus marinus]